jgi:hopanoid biosynthesis associated protein HpnK
MADRGTNTHATRRRVIVSADDFGLSEAVNEAVERAHRDGILHSASLMVAGRAVEDAVRRARAMPGLRVGLHLVAVEGPAVLPPTRIPRLVGPDGQFPRDQLRLALRYAFDPRARRELRDEIDAQFAAFAATGLRLAHADAHKHMHLHPVVGRLLIERGLRHGLRAIRVPAEPPDILRACGERPSRGARALYRYTSRLRARARREGLAVTDHVFGLAWSGHMTADRLLRLARHLPDGTSEIYFHPAARRDATLDRLMPAYEHEAELAALLDPRVRAAFGAINMP